MSDERQDVEGLEDEVLRQVRAWVDGGRPPKATKLTDLVKETRALRQRVEALEAALTIEHKCTKIADFQKYMDLAHDIDGRERHLWIGKLDEPIEGAEHETHCIHLKAGMKPPMVFGVNHGDLTGAAGVILAVLGYHINPHWLEAHAASGIRAAGREPPEFEGRPDVPLEGPVEPKGGAG